MNGLTAWEISSTHLINAGLKIEFLHEFPMIFFKTVFPFMKQDKDGDWRFEGDQAAV